MPPTCHQSKRSLAPVFVQSYMNRNIGINEMFEGLFGVSVEKRIRFVIYKKKIVRSLRETMISATFNKKNQINNIQE
jgi:hypothetical protein